MARSAEENLNSSGSESLRIMVLDDEPIVGKRLQQALAKNGLEVEAFQDTSRNLADDTGVIDDETCFHVSLYFPSP